MNNRAPLERLQEVATFLNLDPDTEFDSEKIPVYWRVPLSHSTESIGDGKRLQDEIRSHLLPIIAPQKQSAPTEADRLINRLITTINAVEQPQVWEIEVADYEWWPKGDPDSPDTDYELEPVPPAERQEGPRFVSSARRISLLGYDWFV